MIPGWIDLQVNGYKGVDFSSPILSEKDITRVCKELYIRGTIGFCATLISSSLDVYERNLPLIAQVQEKLNSKLNIAKILGIHLEGPFINPEEGARGIHDPKYIQNPSPNLITEWLELSRQQIKLLTLSPEICGNIELIRYITRNSRVKCLIGHSLALEHEIYNAIEAGAVGATHIGNGLPDHIHRHLNPLWTFLGDDRLVGLFITDGYHLPLNFLKVALRSKPEESFIVTSDSISIAGKPPGIYSFHNTPIELSENNYLHVQGKYQLAGSGSCMHDCMRYLYKNQLITLNQAKQIGFFNPLRFIGLDPAIFQEQFRIPPSPIQVYFTNPS